MLEKAYARYEAALHGVERYGQRLYRAGHPATAVERVEQLAARLRQRYARYRATGDLAPMRAEIERFLADPWALNPLEDGALPQGLSEALGALHAGVPELTLTVSAEPPVGASGPAGNDFLTFPAPPALTHAVSH